MKAMTASFVALLVPAALCAQVSGQVTVSNVARIGCASVSGSARMKASLQATHDAMVAGGRMFPSWEECVRGASAMEHGVKKAQIEAIARSTRGDRSLVVAFDVLARLVAGGMPVNRAVVQIQENVNSGASDATLVALATSRGTLSTTVNGATKQP
jgi:hypothetical protein